MRKPLGGPSIEELNLSLLKKECEPKVMKLNPNWVTSPGIVKP